MCREHNIVKGFTAPGEQMLSVISCVDLICKWLHSPFLNAFHLHSHYKPSEWNWSSLLLSESLCQDLLWWQRLQVLCQQLLLLQHIADSASCTLFRWRRIFQPLTGLKCTGVFLCVVCLFFFFLWLFLNFPEARNAVPHIWSVELELHGQWRLHSEIVELGCVRRHGIATQLLSSALVSRRQKLWVPAPWNNCNSVSRNL